MAENTEIISSVSLPPVEKVIPPALKALNDLLAAHEANVASLDDKARADYFHKNKTPEDAKTLNALCAKVESLRGNDRKDFFLAHPELEVRYSAGNFVKPTITA